MLRELVDRILRWIWTRSTQRPESMLAYGAAPTIAVLLIVWQMGAVGSLSGVDAVVVVPLRSTVAVGSMSSVHDQPGVVLILEPDARDFRISWQRARLQRAHLSVDANTALENQRRLLIGPEGLETRPPLLGIQQPVVVVAEGVTAQEVWTAKGRSQLVDLAPPSQQSRSLALAGLVVAMFGSGLATAALNDP